MLLARRLLYFFAMLLAVSGPFFYGSAAHAQATRTWVSGVGDDANPCSRTAPCKTFAGAISKTAVAGIINCLDPAGYGAVTITKSITIDCTETLAGVLAAGTNGINVNAANAVVNLRGLDIEGGGTGLIGVNILNGPITVHIENCRIFGFQSGSARAVSVAPTTSGTLVMNNSHLHTNGTGIFISTTTDTSNIALRDAIIDTNSGNGVTLSSAGLHSGATIDRTTLAFNGGTGLALTGAGTVAIIGNSMVTGNNLGVSNAGGVLQSFKNNQIGGNNSDGTPITAFPGPGGPLQ